MRHTATVDVAIERAKAALATSEVEHRFAQPERDDEVDRLLAEVKARKGR